MAQIFANPNLPDYFLNTPEVSCAAHARSFIPEYEAGKLVVFPNFKADIDHEFWSSLPTHRFPELKKYPALVDPVDHCDVGAHFRNLIKQGVDEEFARVLSEQFRRVYSALIPLYYAVFSEYEFDRRKVVWRLSTIFNENMHVDTYKDEQKDHFARMFVNLDNQPRIWQTSWSVEHMIERLHGKISAEDLAGKSRGEVWMTMNRTMFGNSSREWWDSEPRHVVYFDPGDVWIVDSRQVSHQIFYGRRALSIDFSVPRAAMRDPDRHYLGAAGRFRKRVTRSLNFDLLEHEEASAIGR